MSDYPSAKDNLAENFSNSTAAEDNHPAAHNDANSAINAIQDTLGINPQGSSGTVAARMTAIETSAQVVTAGDGLDLDGDELSVDETVVRDDDSRLTDARTPTAHTHPPSQITQGGAASGQVLAWSGSEWAPTTIEAGSGSGGGGGEYTAGDGLDLDGNEFSVDSTVVRDGDSRLTDARTPTAHTHEPEDINADGITSGYVLTVDSGEATWAAPPAGGGSGSGGGEVYTAGDGLDLTDGEFSVDETVVRDDDPRLTDERTPSDNSVTSAKIVDGTITNDDISASAAIAESKLNLASDAAAGTPSRRTLGTGATQAAAGNHTHTSFSSAITVGEATSSNHAVRATQAATLVNHGSTAGTARPGGFGYVIWVGSVEPDNSIDGDLWLET